jgi:hypothetical protein
MSSYHGAVEFASDALHTRFPEDTIGHTILREQPADSPATLNAVLDALINLQRSSPRHRNLPRPRLFISHRHRDERLARKIAGIATGVGFDYWLDVLDPVLRWATQNQNADADRQALIIAILVEMALLNCTHVLAVVTRHTAKSKWVPYEFGRVKSGTMFCPFASAWLSRGIFSRRNFAEYLRLGPIHRTQQDIEWWLKAELRRWHQTQPGSVRPRRTP